MPFASQTLGLFEGFFCVDSDWKNLIKVGLK